MALSKIKTNSIEDDAVTATQIATDAVDTAEIAADAVGASELANDAVDTNAVANNAVTLAKLADGTQGGTIYYGASGAPTELAAGTSGQFLKTLGTSANPAWGTVTLTTINTNADNRVVTGSGTADTLNAEANLTYDGTTVDIKNAGTASDLKLYCESSNAHYVSVKSPSHSAYTGGSWTFTLPGTDGAANEFLQTDGAGATSWVESVPAISWQAVTTAATLTAVAGNGYPINTTSNACVVTLPASASVGDTIEFVDYAGTFDTNRVELDPQSLNIKGASDSLYLTYERQGVRIVYVDATQGWVAATGVNEDNPSISAFSASGGTETTYSDGGVDYKTHTFTSSGTFTVTGIPGLVDAMIVGGGGGGKSAMNGGGGGGGMITMVGYTAVLGAHSMVIGAGGAGTGENGVSTTGFGETSTGGGAGAGHPANGAAGANGGAGGDSTASTGGVGTAPAVVSGTATGRGGNNGGNGGASNGGGGGGLGGVGGNGNAGGAPGGDGGVGLQWNLDGNNYYWGGGGGGGCYYGQAGDGGIGGGGAGTWWTTACAGGGAAGSPGAVGGSAINSGTQATACGTGGAGGANTGAGGAASTANGGSGIVQIRYIV